MKVLQESTPASDLIGAMRRFFDDWHSRTPLTIQSLDKMGGMVAQHLGQAVAEALGENPEGLGEDAEDIIKLAAQGIMKHQADMITAGTRALDRYIS